MGLARIVDAALKAPARPVAAALDIFHIIKIVI